MSEPSDQIARARFRSALDRNFSVVAAAGSGKTRALTDRIVAIAQSTHALEWLPQLIIVTYTNRAANEMQQRARAEILKARVTDVRILSAFNRAFFGTIHSFCVKLLNAHGHFLGLPSQLELVTDDQELWNDFVQRLAVIGRGLSDEARAILLRYVEARRLLELGKRGRVTADLSFNNEPCPEVDLAELLRYQPRGSSVENISRTQDRLREWDRARRDGTEFFPLPLRGSDARDFVALWQEAFGPFRDWLSHAALCAAGELERAYRAYRLTKGSLTYDDQVALALQLFENPEAARRIRGRQYRVILDEAQDTGAAQFGVLLETTRPPEARGLWPNEPSAPPQPGHFCMVGDFQQSIFSGANLQHYRAVHEALIAAPGGESVEFSVSFRLDQQTIDFINATFQEILNGDGQVDFLKMQPRSDVLPGQILRVDFLAPDFPPRTPVGRKARWEAKELARWIRTAGLKNLRAETWRDVAILCPRKLWFSPLRDALLQEGLRVEVQSETEVKGDHPAYAWLSALLAIMADPAESYETVGVLREVFGLSDHDLAVFAQGEEWRFDLRLKQAGNDPVSQKLRLLGENRAQIAGEPLFAAVRELIKTVQLRERLHSLPPQDFENLDDELDALLASAARAESEGISLSEFAQFLRDDFATVREAPAGRKEAAIQLITSHKAKGSEWQAVIVPFLMREVDSRANNFPRLTTDRVIKAQRILFDREEVTPEMEVETKAIERQEMERLLYVALTRAKHTLVLAGAPGLYATSRNPQPSKSQIKWLRCEGGGCNEQAFARLSSGARAETKTAARQNRATAPHPPMQRLSALSASSQAVTKRAWDFVQKITPSDLVEASAMENASSTEELERVPIRAGAFDNEATRYGRWWHNLLQQLDWNQDLPQWEICFQAAVARAPVRARAESEWNLFRSHVSGGSDFRKLLGVDDFLPHSEIPFLRKIGQSAALEGVIDLALIAPSARRALIIDWKTNQIEPEQLAELPGKYRSQLAAYWKAVHDITSFTVEAGLYSTATGQLLLFNSTELPAEWARLVQLPSGQLRREVGPEDI